MNKVPAIGIDLGTTYSCVAVWQRGKVEIIPNDEGNRTTPSYVAFKGSELLIGDAAKSQASINSSNTIYDVKRLIGRKFSDESVQNDIKLWPFKVVAGPVLANDEKAKKPMIEVSYKGRKELFAAEQISAMILTKMKEVAEEFLGMPPKNAVITVPAYFNNLQRQATKDAGVIAGLHVMRIINEPTAAAIAYGFHKHSSANNINVLIFDLGGGTMDVSLVSIENEVVEVKSVSGDTHLGGQDFDHMMVNYFVIQFRRKHSRDIRSNPKSMGRLRTACERAKRSLSSTTSITIDLDGLIDGIDFSVTITRGQFERMNSALFEKCLIPVKNCLRDAAMENTDVDEVVLVGGSTRIPRIQTLLQDLFPGKKFCKSIHPDEAVAYGAATHAALLSCVVDENLLVLDVAPLSLGIENCEGKMSVMIPRNTPIPTRMHKLFTTTDDRQTEVMFCVFEGENITANKNNLLGKFELSGIPPVPKGVPDLNACFEIDADGILKCYAEEQVTGRRSGLNITCHTGKLSEEELGEMRKNAERFKAEDELCKLKLKAMGELDEYAQHIASLLLNCQQIGHKNWKKMQDANDRALKWLDWNYLLTDVCKYESKLGELKSICEPVISKIHSPCDCVNLDEAMD